MKIHRFIGEFNFTQDMIVLRDEALVHQIGRVLRLQKGERIQLCDGKGHEAMMEIVEIQKGAIEGVVRERLHSQSESLREVTLYVAILKKENMAWVVQKATEVGAVSIVPLLTHRTVKQDIRVDRLQQIAREAAEQSGRGIVPVVRDPLSFVDALQESVKHDQNFFFHTRIEGGLIAKHPCVPQGKLGVFVGPEGGWDEEEVSLAQASTHLLFQTLGTFILRGETAAIIATYLAVYGLLF